ncbi:MAG: TonB family protein [Gloeomargarita sp. HHBFW_bins_162]
MVSTWRWRRRQPANLWLYGGISLVLHGVVVLALHWAEPPLEIPEPEKLPPIEIVDAPKVELDQTPPPDTQNRAARNTVEQGTVRPDAPMNLETTQRSAPSATAPQPTQDIQQEKASQPEEPKPIAQAEPEPVTEPSPEPVAQPTPSPIAQPEPPPAPKPVAQPEPQPTPVARTLPPRPPLPLPPKPAQVPLPQPEASPSPAPQVTQPAPPVTRPQPTPAVTRPNPQPAVNPSPAPAPPQVAAAPPKPTGNASLLGGTLSKDARQAPLDQEANTTRNAPGPTQLAARQEVDLSPYLSNLRRRVQQNWNPQNPDQRRQAVIGFTISRSGHVSNMRILQTSGSPQTDAETILAIQRAAPFGPLPEQFPYQQLEIEFTFNIYVNNTIIQSPRSWYGF